MLLLHINPINSALVCFQKKFKHPIPIPKLLNGTV